MFVSAGSFRRRRNGVKPARPSARRKAEPGSAVAIELLVETETPEATPATLTEATLGDAGSSSSTDEALFDPPAGPNSACRLHPLLEGAQSIISESRNMLPPETPD